MLDASLVIAWLVMERLPAADSPIYNSLPDHHILVPEHWPIEIGNALWSRIRARRMSIDAFHTIMGRLDLLSIEVQAPPALEESDRSRNLRGTMN